MTAGGGRYAFSGLANGSYSLTPSLTGYTFTPPSIAVTVSGGDGSSGLRGSARSPSRTVRWSAST